MNVHSKYNLRLFVSVVSSYTIGGSHSYDKSSHRTTVFSFLVVYIYIYIYRGLDGDYCGYDSDCDSGYCKRGSSICTARGLDGDSCDYKRVQIKQRRQRNEDDEYTVGYKHIHSLLLSSIIYGVDEFHSYRQRTGVKNNIIITKRNSSLRSVRSYRRY